MASMQIKLRIQTIQHSSLYTVVCTYCNERWNDKLIYYDCSILTSVLVFDTSTYLPMLFYK